MKKFFTLLAFVLFASTINMANATKVQPWFAEWYNAWTAPYEAELTYNADEDEYCLDTFGGVKLYFSYEYDEESGNNIVYITNRQGDYLVDPNEWTFAPVSFTLKDDETDKYGNHTVDLAMVGFGDTVVKEGYDAAETGGSLLLDIAFYGYTEAAWWDWAKFYCYFNPKAEESAAVRIVTAEEEGFKAYDLMGRKMNAKEAGELSKGIYIINGKKTLVK